MFLKKPRSRPHLHFQKHLGLLRFLHPLRYPQQHHCHHYLWHLQNHQEMFDLKQKTMPRNFQHSQDNQENRQTLQLQHIPDYQGHLDRQHYHPAHHYTDQT